MLEKLAILLTKNLNKLNDLKVRFEIAETIESKNQILDSIKLEMLDAIQSIRREVIWDDLSYEEVCELNELADGIQAELNELCSIEI